MVTEKDLLKAIHDGKDVRSVGFSYKRYKRLKPKEKTKFDKLRSLEEFKFEGIAWSYLLFFHHKLNLDISRGNLRFIIKNLRSLEDKFLFVIQKGNPKNPANYPYKHNIHKKLANQFKFLGYIPLKEYKLRHGYAYITSNISIEGIIYIYPMRLVDDYRKMRPGYYQWQRIFEHHSIAGFTRINYSFSYNKLKMLSI